ncbi:hypothetical protein C0Q70_02227 [Pomacea canaliculata]|uniref:K Homology domain-containing protein n=1 Tax=Pomacea canaliculata TaxID=400727 RepID=A0A2T7Q1N9_POMCA|nr:hypothetical protein C0Q70_02227 [Pomacea canaliculata]
MPHTAYPDAYIQHPATSSPQLVLPPQLPVSTPSSTMGTLISPSQQQAQQAAAGGGGTSQGSNLPCGNGGGIGVKTSNKRNSSGKVQRSKSQQIQQQQQVLSQQQQPPLPPPPPQQQLPLSPQPLSSPPMSLAFQPEHMGGGSGNECGSSPAAAAGSPGTTAASATHATTCTPPLTQDQLLHHMISQQVIQAPLGPFQQPLHQLLPQQPPQPALLTHQERAQLIQQTQQAQLLQHQLLKQAPGTNAASAVTSPSVVGSTGGGEAAGVISDKSQGALYPTSVDVDSQTESNHDTALTLACAGGHAELVSLLLAKGADIEHRDKKGFTPLILAATAGHVDVVEILLEHGAEIEAQSERTKDTPLSLACSGGRYEVVELLLTKGANKEHRNVSDYTPLSLAASGGYVNIIKLLLSHGAEINSRTGSKLGISPLMLAAMNGHTAAVKLLLDMGSDINAQIETNRNTALTLACFQGRHEVVSLLVDRKANIEHRAKTGLTPLMEAASGGYVEVGRVLLDKGADVNAAPVPSSRDTALTIAADKGHYRFVELLLHRGAAVDVKNKKGNSPLWLACNGGHLDVVQLLVSAGADVDSQDNRKVSCLMAAFRKGHVKVVKWKVKHVTQFPSDAELQRFIATVTDKELQKKCQQCMDIIVTAKDRQAAEANKNATSLLLEIDKERQVEEHRRLQAAKRRERRKAKKREKLKEKDKDKNSSPEPEGTENHLEDNDDDEYDDQVEVGPPSATVTSTIGTTLVKNTEAKSTRPNMIKLSPSLSSSSSSSTGPALTPPGNAITSSTNSQSISSTISNSSSATELKKNRRNRKEKIEGMELKRNHLPSPSSPPASVSVSMATSLAVTIAMMTNAGGKLGLYSIAGNNSSSSNTFTSSNSNNNTNSSKCKKNDIIKQPPPSGKNRVGDLDDFGSVSGKVTYKDVDKLGRNLDKVKIAASDSMCLVERDSNLAPKLSPLGTSPRKGQRKDEGWKEVTRKSKKVQVPANAISRVIGRGGCNINAIRETSGAHVEVEKPKGSGDRFIMIKGSAEATRQAHAMINALVQEPDKDLSEIISRTKGKPVEKIQQTPATIGDFAIGMFSVPTTSATTTSGNGQHSGKTSTSGKSQSNRQASTPSTALNGMRLSSSTTGPPITVWQNQQSNSGTPASPRRSSPQKQLSSNASSSTSMPSLTSGTANQEKGISRQLFSSEPHRRAGSATPTTSSSTPPSFNISNPTLKSSVVTVGRNSTDRQQTPTNIGTSSTSGVTGASISSKTVGRPGSSTIRLLQRQGSGTTRSDPQPLPIVSSHVSTSISPATTSVTSSAAQASPGNYSPFESTIFSNVTVQFLNKKEEEKLNFASVAAAGVVPSQSSPLSGQPPSGLPGPGNEVDPNLQAKAPGYKMGIRTASPQSRPEQANRVSANMHFQLPLGGGCYPGPSLPPGVSMPPRPSLPNPASDGGSMSPHNPPHMSSLDHMASQHNPLVPQQLSQTPLHHPLSSNQKEEYSTPHQPMTLPEIKSTLNPNAPDFCVMGSGIVSTPSSLVNGFASSGMGDGRVGSDLGNGMGGGGGNNSAVLEMEIEELVCPQ